MSDKQTVCIVLNDLPGYPRADGHIPAIMGFRGVYSTFDDFLAHLNELYEDLFWEEDNQSIGNGTWRLSGRVFLEDSPTPLYYAEIKVGNLNAGCYMDLIKRVDQ